MAQTTTKDKELLIAVGRAYPAFVEYLERELEGQHELLEQLADESLMRRAQGHAQCLKGLLKQLKPSSQQR